VDWELLQEKSRSERAECDEHERLYIPGVVLHMVRIDGSAQNASRDSQTSRRPDVEMIRVPREDFQVIKRAKGMLIKHAPSEYRKSLVDALKSLGADTLKRTRDAKSLLRTLPHFPVTRRTNLDASSADDVGEVFPSESIDFLYDYKST
jgi:hypothetical protein